MDPPPRPTSKIRLPDETLVRKSVFGRAKLNDIDDAKKYKELKCTSSITQMINHKHIFHSFELNNRSSWSEKTDVLCYHCCHSFETLPVPIPISYDAYASTFQVFGNFCSLSCAKSYLLEAENGNPHLVSLFLKMAADVYGVTCDIPTAPPRLALACFGGCMTISQFRQNNKTVSLQKTPFINSYVVIEEKQQLESASDFSVPVGSVKGLQRPTEKVKLIMSERPAVSPYEKFLSDNNISF